MVLSKISEDVSYPELKRVNADDLKKKANLYEVDIDDVDILIAVGNMKKTFEKQNIIYYPIYFVKHNNKVIQIGVFEIPADHYLDYLDEDDNLDVEKVNDPLIYQFVTKTMLEKLRMVPTQPLSQSPQPNKPLNKETNVKQTDVNLNKSEIDSDNEEEEDEDEDLANYKTGIPKDREDIFTLTKGIALAPILEEETKEIAKNIKKKFKESTSDNWIQTFMKNDNYSIVDNEGGGDCLFSVVRDAYSSIGQQTTVKKIREKLSNEMNEITFSNYKLIYDKQMKILGEITQKINSNKEKYKQIQRKFESTIDKSEKDNMRAESKILKNDIDVLKKEKELANNILDDFKIMDGITSLDKFREKIKTCDFWADTWAISTLERILNIKFIFLSSEYYGNGDKNNVLQCGQLNDEILQKKGYFKPEFYIMSDYTGSHYKLIGYKDKLIFKFVELPYEIKKMVIEKCLEKNSGPFSIIPEFIELKKQKDKKGGGGEKEINDILFDNSKYDTDIYDNDIVFMMDSHAGNSKKQMLPGMMSGEKMAYNKMTEFAKLALIPFWRNKLSNQWVQPFMTDNRKWASIEHYCQACKFKENHPAFYSTFSLDSGTELSQNPEMAKCAGIKNGEFNGDILRPVDIFIDPNYAERKHKIKYDAQLAKIKQNEDLKNLLLETRDAMLLHYKKGREPSQMNELMTIRNNIKNNLDDAYIYA